MAEQIVLHVRLVNDLIFCAVEDAPDQLFIGDCTRQLSDGDLFRSMETTRSTSRCPAESAKANRTFFPEVPPPMLCLYVVAHKNDVLRPVRPQRVQNGIQLCIAQDHKDHIVHCIRCKFSHHRNAADRGAERKFVLDPQAVLLDLRSPVSPRKQSDILSGAQQISCQIAPQNACTIYQNFIACLQIRSSRSAFSFRCHRPWRETGKTADGRVFQVAVT